jgi:hypothetical protein
MINALISCCKPSARPQLSNANYLFVARQDDGSQKGCWGAFSIEKADAVWQKLQKNPAPGISFARTIIHTARSISGTCTAMSLEFASTYFRLREQSEGMSPNSKPFLDKLRSLQASFETSSEEMRSRQIAFSSITVDPKARIDISRSKIESCVKVHNFAIDHCTNEIDITAEAGLLQKEISSLPPGVYFIRMLKPKNNHKLEARGHSMIYVHEKDVSFFYDNNSGLETIVEDQLPGRLLTIHKQWDIPKVRLYRLRDHL